MNGDIRATNMIRAAEALLKSQSPRSVESGFQNCFDVRNMESPRDFGPITKNSTKDSRLSLFHRRDYTSGVIPDQAPSPTTNSGRPAKMACGTKGKNSKKTSQVSENSHQFSDKAGAEVD